jgi:hypothetical protein
MRLQVITEILIHYYNQAKELPFLIKKKKKAIGIFTMLLKTTKQNSKYEESLN